MTYTIQRYPVHLIDVVRVANGSRVTIRPILPQDIDLQRTFFRSLSEEARRLRFMTRLAELPAALVERFANADHASHVALLAEVFENGRERMIGEAHYVVDGHDPAACEFAIAVADDRQRSGIARALLDRLEHQAALSGVRCMAADTLATNGPMIALAMCTGYTVTINPQDATLARLEKTKHRRSPPDAAPSWEILRVATGVQEACRAAGPEPADVRDSHCTLSSRDRVSTRPRSVGRSAPGFL